MLRLSSCPLSLADLIDFDDASFFFQFLFCDFLDWSRIRTIERFQGFDVQTIQSIYVGWIEPNQL